MPKKLLKRFIPSQQFIKDHPSLAFLGPLLEDPNLFHLNRYSVSVAFIVGTFLAFFPTPGQMFIAGSIAFMLRCNLPIAVGLTWITNPITIPPIFFATYKLGTWVLDTPAMDFNVAFTWEWINTELRRLWKPLLVGSMIAGTTTAIISYMSIQLLWRWRVIYAWQHRKERRAKRQLKQHKQRLKK